LILLLTEQEADSLNGEKEAEASDPDPSPGINKNLHHGNFIILVNFE